MMTTSLIHLPPTSLLWPRSTAAASATSLPPLHSLTDLTATSRQTFNNLQATTTSSSESDLLPFSSTTSAKSTRKKQVTFAAPHTVQAIPISSQLDQLRDEEIPSIWYDGIELWEFREEARTLCRQLRVAIAASYVPSTEGAKSKVVHNGATLMAMMAKMGNTKSNNNNDDDDVETPRGLEYRVCQERQRRKGLVGKLIVQSQRQMDSNQLAALAHRCNQWAARTAHDEATLDFARVYGPHTACVLAQNEQLSSSSSSSSIPALGCKRSRSPQEDEGGDCLVLIENGRRVCRRIPAAA